MLNILKYEQQLVITTEKFACPGIVNNDARLILRWKLNGAMTRWSPNWKPNCNRGQLFRSYWVSSARCSKLWSMQLVDWYSQTKCRWWWPQMKLKSKIFANWPVSHAKRVTRDKRKNPEYHVIAAIRKLQTEKLSRRRIMAKPWTIVFILTS